MQRFVVLSDDLTGASGVASMIDGAAATVNLDQYDRELKSKKILCVNLDTRDAGKSSVKKTISGALDKFQDEYVTLRIDSALRGDLLSHIESMLQRGKLLVTDTIPEYKRYTSSGKTILGRESKSISSLLKPRLGTKDSLIVADSKTHSDLRRLAEFCVRENYLPIDPGPLISIVAKLKLKQRKSRMHNKCRKIAFVVGTSNPATLEQLDYMSKLGYGVNNPKDDVDFFHFSKNRSITESFVDSLEAYDALVLSGGETANHVLKKSGAEYIENTESIQPLVSSGRIIGGSLHGRCVVLKGGLIGDGRTYERIIGWLKS